ncbi:uncharacterized protein [Diadema antillarum]|uniref:uncharacterized protein n=1 Tax=Diadema antillarum TaxID=105358 RepID=UPI003A8809AF
MEQSYEQHEPGSSSDQQPKLPKQQQKVIPLHGSKVVKSVMEAGYDIYKEALERAQKDDHLKNYPTGREVIRVCELLLKSPTDESRKSALGLVESVHTCACAGDAFPVGPAANEKICSAFHRLRTQTSLQHTWQTLLLQSNITSSPQTSHLSLQYILRQLLHIITHRRLIQPDEIQTDDSANLTEHDENVLRYVAGYIPFALSKRYTKTNSKFYRTLQSWRGSDEDIVADTFLEYTCTWTNLVNRGGLFRVKDNVYMLFRAMEIQTKRTLNMNLAQSPDLGGLLTKALLQSEHVLHCWTSLIEDLTESEAQTLLLTVVRYWVKIRVNAFVRVFLNLRKEEQAKKKRSKKIARKGEKSLRKTLQK